MPDDKKGSALTDAEVHRIRKKRLKGIYDQANLAMTAAHHLKLYAGPRARRKTVPLEVLFNLAHHAERWRVATQSAKNRIWRLMKGWP